MEYTIFHHRSHDCLKFVCVILLTTGHEFNHNSIFGLFCLFDLTRSDKT